MIEKKRKKKNQPRQHQSGCLLNLHSVPAYSVLNALSVVLYILSFKTWSAIKNSLHIEQHFFLDLPLDIFFKTYLHIGVLLQDKIIKGGHFHRFLQRAICWMKSIYKHKMVAVLKAPKKLLFVPQGKKWSFCDLKSKNISLHRGY